MSEKCSMEFEECENPHYQGDAREAFLRREIDLETREIAEEWQAGHDHHAPEVAELREVIEYLSSAMESRADWISSLQAENAVLDRALRIAAQEALIDYQIATFDMMQHGVVTAGLFSKRWLAQAREDLAKEANNGTS